MLVCGAEAGARVPLAMGLFQATAVENTSLGVVSPAGAWVPFSCLFSETGGCDLLGAGCLL